MPKPSHTIDGSSCRDFPSTIAEFNRAFERWWGKDYWNGNLDGFNDLVDWVHDGEPYVLVWSQSDLARRQLGHQAMAAWLTSKLSQCEPGYGAHWKEQLAEVQQGRGQTLFDLLVEIITEHDQIELRME